MTKVRSVARLRQSLGPDVFRTAAGGYRLAVAESRIDLWEFRDLLWWAGAAGEIAPRLGEEWFTEGTRLVCHSPSLRKAIDLLR